jgi:hypothetical protein
MKQHLVISVAVLSLIGCANLIGKKQPTSIDTFCLWAKPMTVSLDELCTMSYETLKQLDYYNTNYEKLCANKKK